MSACVCVCVYTTYRHARTSSLLLYLFVCVEFTIPPVPIPHHGVLSRPLHSHGVISLTTSEKADSHYPLSICLHGNASLSP